MSSVSGLEPAGGSDKEAAIPDDADRAFRLALTAWGDRCWRPGDDREPGEAPDAVVTSVFERLARSHVRFKQGRSSACIVGGWSR